MGEIGGQGDTQSSTQNSKFKIQNSKLSLPTPHTPFIEIGKIVAAQGMKGEVRIYPDSDFPERFMEPGTRWLLEPEAIEPQPVELLHGRYLAGKGLYVVQFAGIDDRTQAEALQGCKLLVPAGDRPPLEEDEFHVLDLIGLEVFEQATQTLVGTVERVIPAGNDLLEVRRASQPEPAAKRSNTVLIPFVKSIVPIVDLHHHRIEITPPAGLIEL
ncbi:ribosome maturation factor RimM [Kovacikia minuta CCNUW1]|uniref:ribosome maturation factor RimM n=1 Tax=Kovacikia minuta TaxID=2931930 RepID=UPI001CC913F9|nr:ribosome maturation factor RimM [Kovacikia minuta]UBF28088.1 ribosome maturation factor RimM [Kovacikia minuta CCNUW1]